MTERTAVLRVYAAVCRVHRAAGGDFHRIIGTLELFVLMRAQGYSKTTFKAALRKFALAMHEPFWSNIAPLLDLL